MGDWDSQKLGRVFAPVSRRTQSRLAKSITSLTRLTSTHRVEDAPRLGFHGKQPWLAIMYRHEVDSTSLTLIPIMNLFDSNSDTTYTVTIPIMVPAKILFMMYIHSHRKLWKPVGAMVNIYFSDSGYVIIWRPPLNYLAAAT